MGRFAHINLTGKQFGRLSVIAKTTWGWLCRCKCGQEKPASASDLFRGKAKSCGCLKREKKTAFGVAARNYVFAKYRRQAKARGYAWELSSEQFDELTCQDCHYCGLPPSNTTHRRQDPFTYSGIDRKNNDVGYTTDNVVPCCKTCNFLKRQTPYEEFVAYLNRVVEFRARWAKGVSA